MKREQWQLWSAAIPKTRCEEWLNILKKEVLLQDATTFSKHDTTYRNTKIGWTDNPDIKNNLQAFLNEANRNVFNFDINYIPSIQFGEYGEGCLYEWHHDVDWESTKVYDRKLSIAVQLTDSSEYDGGDFEFRYLQKPSQFKEQGSVLVFPSYQEHRVTKILSGTRHSLVCWAEGPRWR